MPRLDGLTALITGAASGFGREIAASYLREGANVMLADRDSDGVAAALADLATAKAASVTVDVTDRDGLDAAVAQTEETFGSLSTLVANAGIGQRPIAPADTPADEMRRQYEINAIGAALTCQAALPALRRHGPGASIILTVSGIVMLPRPEFTAYGMAKSATAYLAKSLAMDLAPEGIRVNGLFPAISDTGMFGEFTNDDPSQATALVAAMPLGRMVTPADVAAAAVYLASPTEAAAITGCVLPVDSGRTM